MAKKKKNGNYQTEGMAKKQQEREQAKQKRKQQRVMKKVGIAALCVTLAVGIFIGIGAIFGMFEYQPEPTYHASILVKNYGTLHVELYGNDAPETVEHFKKLAEEGKFNNLSFHTLLGGMLYGGYSESGRDEGIKGEFSANGVDNRVKHKVGTISMARGEGYDSAYGQFFITLDDADTKALDGNYAAFGRIIEGMEYIEQILQDFPPDENGNIVNGPQILTVTLHEHHD